MTWDNRLTFEVSSASPSATPVWVDLTRFVNDSLSNVVVQSGAVNDLQTVEPSRAGLVLNNGDLIGETESPNAGRFTYGNSLSPYASFWKPGALCRIRERVSVYTFDLITGYLQLPTETVTTAGLDEQVSITILDLLGKLGVADTFISTLAAHILYTGGTTLKAYYPLNEVALPFVDASSNGQVAARTSIVQAFADTGVPSLAPQAGGAPPGDEAQLCALTASTILGQYEVITMDPQDRGASNNFGTLAAGQTLTVVVWVNSSLPTNYAAYISGLLEVVGNDAQLNIHNDANGNYTLTANSAVSGTVTAQSIANGVWQPIAIRYGLSPQVFELWQGANRFVGTLSGSSPASDPILFTDIGAFQGGVGHLQVYIGDPNAFSFTTYLAQMQVGLTGLAGQKTGARITSIAQYAGIPSTRLNAVDAGAKTMSIARLAGKTPLDAMKEAETTEQGLLYVNGSGQLVFADSLNVNNY